MAIARKIEIFGKALGEQRTRRGLRQEDVADRAGVSVRTLREAERGNCTPGSLSEIVRAINELSAEQAEKDYVPLTEDDFQLSNPDVTLGGIDEKPDEPRPIKPIDSSHAKRRDWIVDLVIVFEQDMDWVEGVHSIRVDIGKSSIRERPKTRKRRHFQSEPPTKELSDSRFCLLLARSWAEVSLKECSQQYFTADVHPLLSAIATTGTPVSRMFHWSGDKKKAVRTLFSSSADGLTTRLAGNQKHSYAISILVRDTNSDTERTATESDLERMLRLVDRRSGEFRGRKLRLEPDDWWDA